jgi:hypothetical protein
MSRSSVFLLGVVCALGCRRDDQLVRQLSDSIAVTTGDFDDIVEPLNRMVVARTEYEGLISVATWDDTYEPANVSLKVESLFGDGQELENHGVLFVASGTRGLGNTEYNGVDPDDQFVSDPYVAAEIADFVGRGGVLFATDWAYDLIEAAFPDAIDFLGNDTEFDAAQAGDMGVVQADVLEPALADAIQSDVLATRFDFSNWAVIEGVSDDVTVWLQGDATYRMQDGEGSQEISDVPLLVSFSPSGARNGRVIYASFHVDAQTDAVIDQVLRTVIGDFEERADEPVAPIP